MSESQHYLDPAFLIADYRNYFAKLGVILRLTVALAGLLAIVAPLVGSATLSVACSHASCSSENRDELGSMSSSLLDNMPGWHAQLRQ